MPAQALNAIVAADPAKQRWLLSKGVMPLMYRLLRPPVSVGSTLGASPTSTSSPTPASNSDALMSPHSSMHAKGTGSPPASRELSLTSSTWTSVDGGHSSGGQTSTSAHTPSSQLYMKGNDVAAASAKSWSSWLPSAPWRLRAQPTADGSSGCGGGNAAAATGGAAPSASGQAAAPNAAAVTAAALPPIPDVYTDHDGPLHLCLKRQVHTQSLNV
jgi:hypothetical protein